MKELLKNWLFQSEKPCFFEKKTNLIIFLVFKLCYVNSQVNQVSNPSFETHTNCSLTAFQLFKAVYWNSIDSSKIICGADYYHSCATNVNFSTPSNGYSYQKPRTGDAYILGQFYCISPACSYPYYRGYLKNRLSSNLVAGKVYCAKMYVNLAEKCLYGMDALGMCFSDNSVDTIQNCGVPLTYLLPQVSNPSGNIIVDTANWVEISGTFTATGSEKYLVIGNFVPDASVNKTVVNNGYPTWAGYNIDDVSVIDFDLQAYTGPDKNIFLGDSTFIGRPPEIGLECTWTTGTSTVGTGGGIWVKPSTTGTFSYVVTQNICGNIKTDTVNVNISAGLKSENEIFSESISVYPQPASDVVTLSLQHFYDPFIKISVYDLTGKIVRSSEIAVRSGKADLSTHEFPNGVYMLRLQSRNDQAVSKRLVITR